MRSRTTTVANAQLAEMLPKNGPKRANETFLKFTFQLESIIVNLNTAPGVGLASFGIYHLSLKGYQLVDQSLFASIVLCDMQLDDCRAHREHMITKYMGKKSITSVTAVANAADAVKSVQQTNNTVDNAVDDDAAVVVKPETTMLDIVVRLTSAEMFANLVVSSFDLILSLEFLMQVVQFLKLPDDPNAPIVADAVPPAPSSGPPSPVQRSPTTASASVAAVAAAAGAEAATGKKMTVVVKIEQPDIILVEEMDNINCLALVMNVSIDEQNRYLDRITRQICTNFRCTPICEFADRSNDKSLPAKLPTSKCSFVNSIRPTDRRPSTTYCIRAI